MKKIKILQLDFTKIQEQFVSYSAGIYQKTLSVPQITQDASFWVTDFGFTWDFPVEPVTVGSVRVDDSILGSVSSIEELRLQDGSFYFDVASQTLYLALSEYYNAWNYRTYKAGQTRGFISESQGQLINGQIYAVDSYVNSNYFEPRLIGDISASISVDDQKNGIFVYDELQAAINNGDGEFDDITEDVTGNEARVLIADIASSPEEEYATGYPYKIKAEQSDFDIVRLGVVDDISYSNPDEPQVNAIDIRSDWSQTISTEFMTVADYPNLEDKYIDKRKPLLIGKVNGSACIQLEPDPATSTATKFLICDTTVGDINTVTDIYFDGKISGADYDDYLTAGMYSVDTSTGELTVNNFDKGKAYFYGTVTEMTETVEIVRYLLNKYANLADIPSNFNQKEMDKIAALNYNTHVYVTEKGSKLSSVIEKLVMDINVDFFQQGSVLTMRLGNEQRASVEDITPTQIYDNPAGWVTDRTDTVKTITVTYSQDYRTKDNDTYYDDSNEEDALDNNRKAVDKVFDTNLTQISDVTEIYDAYYNRFVVPSRTVTVNKAFPSRAGLTDFVTFKVTRKNAIDGDKDIFPRGLYKVIDKDPINNTLEIVYFADSPEPYYSYGLAAGARNITRTLTRIDLLGGTASYLNPAYINPAFGIYPVSVDYDVTAQATTRGHAFGAPSGENSSGQKAGQTQQVGQ